MCTRSQKEESDMSGERLPSTMKAVRLHKFGAPERLQLDTDVPLPVCGAKQVDTVMLPFCIIVLSNRYRKGSVKIYSFPWLLLSRANSFKRESL